MDRDCGLEIRNKVYEMHWHPRGISTLNEKLLGTRWKSMIGVRCDAITEPEDTSTSFRSFVM